MGRPDLADDARFAERRERIRNGAECNAIIAEWSASRTKRAIYEACYAGGCPVGPFYDAKEIAEDPQMTARGFFVEADHAAAGRRPYPSAPYHFPATPWRMARAAPLLGEHNDLVYRERLGLSTDDLAALRAAGGGLTTERWYDHFEHRERKGPETGRLPACASSTSRGRRRGR